MSSTATAHARPAARPAPATLADVAVATMAFAVTIMLLRHGGLAPSRPGTAPLDLAGVALAAGSTLPLFARRHAPLGVFATTATVSVAMVVLGYPLDLLPGSVVALYHLASGRGRDVTWTWRTTVTVAALLVAYLGAAAVAHRTVPGIELLHTGLTFGVAWFAGERTCLRRQQIGELEQRALRAEREIERERLLAAAEERTRIARDLHDSAGHAVSVIAVRAGAARLRHRQDPDRSLAALASIEEVARHTADDIDRMVGALRDGTQADGVLAAPIGLAGIDALVARHEAAGLAVTVSCAGASRRLASAVDQAVYRILQEALTNASRHGTGRARVELAFADTAVEVTVANPEPTRPAPRSGGGHGLVGMRERVTRLGGHLRVHRTDGTFVLRTSIPYDRSPDLTQQDRP